MAAFVRPTFPFRHSNVKGRPLRTAFFHLGVKQNDDFRTQTRTGFTLWLLRTPFQRRRRVPRRRLLLEVLFESEKLKQSVRAGLALRGAARRVDRDRAGWPHDGRVSHRSVDLLADRRGNSKAVQGPIQCGAFIADSPRAGLQPAEAAASGARAGSRCGRTLAKVGLAADQKKANRSRASIAFIDETGFRLQPVNRRTWALTGVTPVQRAWDRYDRLSVIGAVTLSPTRRRISTPFQVYEENIRAEHVVYFIQELRKRLRRPLIICLDRWSVHRSAARRIKALAVPGVQFEWLPAYAPELNPVEARWCHVKVRRLGQLRA
jgi:hypothetical protein